MPKSLQNSATVRCKVSNFKIYRNGIDERWNCPKFGNWLTDDDGMLVYDNIERIAVRTECKFENLSNDSELTQILFV